MAFQYLKEDVVQGLAQYKYSVVDSSPFSKYVSHPFFNLLVQIVPKWIAPNVLTIIGFSFLITQFTVMAFYDPHFYASADNPLGKDHAPVPEWVWLFSAFCIFMSYTLDSIDGKQARRTDCCGAMGELFDHGADRWNPLLWSANIYTIIGRGDFTMGTTQMVVILVILQVANLLFDLERYNTGTCTLPWEFDIGIICLIAVNLATYYNGYHYWKFEVPYVGYSPLELVLYTVCE